MYKPLLQAIKTVFAVTLTASLLSACDADSSEPTPVPAPTHTSFTLTDSIKVDSTYSGSNPDLFQYYQHRTYQVNAINQAEVYFYEENKGVTLYFKNTSSQKEQSWVTLHFKNRTVENLPAMMSLAATDEVCVHNGQSFKDGSAALSPNCVTVLGGTVSLRYDPQTNVLNGSISNLSMALDYYVPEYAFPNRAGNIFKASGSTRLLNIAFENVQSRKVS